MGVETILERLIRENEEARALIWAIVQAAGGSVHVDEHTIVSMNPQKSRLSVLPNFKDGGVTVRALP